MALNVSNGHNYNGNGFYNYYGNATAGRVRHCLFSKFIIESNNSECESVNVNSYSLLNDLAEPSVEFQDAIIDLLNVPDKNMELNERISRLLAALSSTDCAEALAAVKELQLLAKAHPNAISDNAQLITSLIAMINRSKDLNLQRDALAALSHLATSPNGRLHMFRSGGIEGLIRMLRSSDDAVRRYAVATLHNLLLYLDVAKDEITVHGGLEVFIPLLGDKNPKLQAMVADCIYHLLLDRANSKQTFLKHEGPSYLVKVLRGSSEYIKLLCAVTRCVRSVSVEQQNKAALVSLGCLEALHAVLVHIEDPKKKLIFLNAIRNLSDAATNLETLSSLVADLLLILEGNDDEETVSCVCGILSNLTCNNVRNKQTVTECGGIGALLRTAGHYSNIEDITEPALCTLRHCTVRHPLAQRAQMDVRQTEHGYQIVLSLLATRRPPIVKAALGVARNCAILEQNLRVLLSERTHTEEQILPLTLEVLQHSGSRLRQDFEGLTEGVSLLELVETATSALHQFSRDVEVAKVIYRDPIIMAGLIDLMGIPEIFDNDDMLVLREILGIFYQITLTVEGAAAVRSSGAVPFIVDAYNKSPTNAVAVYSKVILRKLELEDRDELQYNGRIIQQEYRGHLGWVNDGLEPELYNEFFTMGEMNHIDGDRQEFYNGISIKCIFLERRIIFQEIGIDAGCWLLNRLILGCSDGSVVVLCPFKGGFEKHQAAASAIVAASSFAPNRIVLATESAEIKIVEFSETSEFLIKQTVNFSSEQRIFSLAVSSQWSYIAVGLLNRVAVININTGEQCLIAIPQSKTKATIIWSLLSFDSLLFAGDSNGRIHILNSNNGAIVKTIKTHEADILCLCSDGKDVFASGVDYRIQILSSNKGKDWATVGQRIIHHNDVRCMTYLSGALISGGAEYGLLISQGKNTWRPIIKSECSVNFDGLLALFPYVHHADLWRLPIKSGSLPQRLLMLKLPNGVIVDKAALSSNGYWVAFSTLKGIYLYNINNVKEPMRVAHYPEKVQSVICFAGKSLYFSRNYSELVKVDLKDIAKVQLVARLGEEVISQIEVNAEESYGIITTARNQTFVCELSSTNEIEENVKEINFKCNLLDSRILGNTALTLTVLPAPTVAFWDLKTLNQTQSISIENAFTASEFPCSLSEVNANTISIIGSNGSACVIGNLSKERKFLVGTVAPGAANAAEKKAETLRASPEVHLTFNDKYSVVSISRDSPNQPSNRPFKLNRYGRV